MSRGIAISLNRWQAINGTNSAPTGERVDAIILRAELNRFLNSTKVENCHM